LGKLKFAELDEAESIRDANPSLESAFPKLKEIAAYSVDRRRKYSTESTTLTIYTPPAVQDLEIVLDLEKSARERVAAADRLRPVIYALLYPDVVDLLQGPQPRGRKKTPEGQKAEFKYWHAQLQPLAKRAKGWIKKQRHEKESMNRSTLWREYVGTEASQPHPDEVAGVLQERDSQPPIWPALYLQLGIVPRELFMLLAQTKPRTLSPSTAVRQYIAGEPLRISWSVHTRKSLRNK
jgi:hypothetical protein